MTASSGLSPSGAERRERSDAPVPDASVVVVAYRSQDWLPRCLGALPAAFGDRSYEVVVVDNASPDDSVGVVRRQFPDVELVASDVNLGFGRAVNLGARATRGRHVLLLNPDTEARPGSLAALLAFAEEHPGAGIVGGRTLQPDGTPDPTSAMGLPSLWSRVCFGLGLETAFRRNRLLDPQSLGSWERDSVREVGMVTGCLAVLERSVWDEVGGFDERFWMYGEDVDLSTRLRARGYRPTITPDAVVVHAVGASAVTRGDKRVQLLRGLVTYDRIHAPAWQLPLRRAFVDLGVAIRGLLSRRPGTGVDGWDEAWRRRHEWRGGYPESDGQPWSPAEPPTA